MTATETPTSLPAIETTTPDGRSVRLRLGGEVRVSADLDEPHPLYASRTGVIAWLSDPAKERLAVGVEFNNGAYQVWFAPDEVKPVETAASGAMVDVALPAGVSAQEIRARREDLVRNLGRAQHEVSGTGTASTASSTAAASMASATEPSAIQAAAQEAAEALRRLFALAAEDCTVEGPVEALDALTTTGGPLNALSEGIDGLKSYLAGFGRAEDGEHDAIDSALDCLDLVNDSVEETLSRFDSTARCLRELI